MAVTTTIARGYAWRNFIFAVVCAVFGAWGVVDYTVRIPRRQLLNERLGVIQLCKEALETEQGPDRMSPEALEAMKAVEAELGRMIPLIVDTARRQGQRIPTPEELTGVGAAEVVVQLERGDRAWVEILVLIGRGLQGERHLPLSGYPQAEKAYQECSTFIDQVGRVAAPAKYDRIMQWLFIACLPMAPYFLWTVLRTRRRVYRLDDDGTLHMPEGTWAARDVADIDMSRWMAKSIAWVVHRDGTRVKLDDYKHRNLHLIVGAVASRLHPADWTPEARPLQGAAAGAGPPQPA